MLNTTLLSLHFYTDKQLFINVDININQMQRAYRLTNLTSLRTNRIINPGVCPTALLVPRLEFSKSRNLIPNSTWRVTNTIRRTSTSPIKDDNKKVIIRNNDKEIATESNTKEMVVQEKPKEIEEELTRGDPKKPECDCLTIKGIVSRMHNLGGTIFF